MDDIVHGQSLAFASITPGDLASLQFGQRAMYTHEEDLPASEDGQPVTQHFRLKQDFVEDQPLTFVDGRSQHPAPGPKQAMARGADLERHSAVRQAREEKPFRLAMPAERSALQNVIHPKVQIRIGKLLLEFAGNGGLSRRGAAIQEHHVRPRPRNTEGHPISPLSR